MNARMALRLATTDAHERLHRIPDFIALAEGRIGRDAYLRLLRQMLGFHAPMERAIFAALGGETYGLAVASLPRAHRLCDDIVALDPSGVVEGAGVKAPPLGSPEAAMGALYVTEGSTLGGRVLARGLDTILPAGTVAGRSFLLAGVDRARPAWSDICVALERCGEDPARRAAMIAAATATFALFAAWFAPSEASGPAPADVVVNAA